jgi:hypothetical protein
LKTSEVFIVYQPRPDYRSDRLSGQARQQVKPPRSDKQLLEKIGVLARTDKKAAAMRAAKKS